MAYCHLKTSQAWAEFGGGALKDGLRTAEAVREIAAGLVSLGARSVQLFFFFFARRSYAARKGFVLEVLPKKSPELLWLTAFRPSPCL